MSYANTFLGGTCNGSNWRENLIPLLKKSYYNPVVEDWTPKCQEEEIRQRENCNYCLYVITPKMTGVYSIAEVVDDSNKRPSKTIFCYLTEDDGAIFEKHQIKALDATGNLVSKNGGMFFKSLERVADFINVSS